MIGSQTPKAPSSCGIYDAVTLKCGNTGRLLSRRESQRGRRKRGGQARGSDNSSARAGRARMAPAGGQRPKAADLKKEDHCATCGPEFAENRSNSHSSLTKSQGGQTT